MHRRAVRMHGVPPMLRLTVHTAACTLRIGVLNDSKTALYNDDRWEVLAPTLAITHSPPLDWAASDPACSFVPCTAL